MSPAFRQHLYRSRLQLSCDILFYCQHLTCDAALELNLSLGIPSHTAYCFMLLNTLFGKAHFLDLNVLSELCLKDGEEIWWAILEGLIHADVRESNHSIKSLSLHLWQRTHPALESLVLVV